MRIFAGQIFSKFLRLAAGFQLCAGLMSKRGAIFMNGNGNQEILTLRELAVMLRCSKAHVSKLLNGKVPGVPPLTHMAIGRRKVTRRDWLQTWMEGYKQC
jgi:hypothetical protein